MPCSCRSLIALLSTPLQGAGGCCAASSHLQATKLADALLRLMVDFVRLPIALVRRAGQARVYAPWE
ncbi:hypothetical protein LPU83_pLPU83c_0473 (plasmid) [Rhizobium favelukesii]|uniref:Secreted protein n=1 Tax=Rhizobium favelukesii TaxID=348824 RepID=W6RLB6_9HYPH|nr:hypothetical protein LPU83_pLPU83c_0473 [Rhizobium favelukesii]